MLFFGTSWYGLVFCSQNPGKSEWWCFAMTSHLHTWEIVTNDTMSHHIFIYINFFVFCSIFFIKIFSRVNICVTLWRLWHFSTKNILKWGEWVFWAMFCIYIYKKFFLFLLHAFFIFFFSPVCIYITQNTQNTHFSIKNIQF